MCCLLCVLGCCLFFLHYSSALHAEIEAKEEIRIGLQGGRVDLPCLLKRHTKNQKILTVLWYKNGNDMPVYTYDARGQSFPEASHRVDPAFTNRAYFYALTSPPRLSLESLRNHDSGLYICRIDFPHSKTQYTRVRLNVIIPPDDPVIRDGSGNILKHMVGPVTEGSNLHLSCWVEGGRPEPQVMWYRDGELIDSSFYYYANKDLVINELIDPDISRSNYQSVYSCEANNTRLSKPITASVTLDMNLSPLWVHIIESNMEIHAGTEYKWFCLCSGSRPLPRISWWLQDQQLKAENAVSTSSDGNETTSSLVYIPTSQDDGLPLSCRCHNTKLKGAVITHTIKLDVKYKPEVRLKLGDSLTPSKISEGDDVYFECKIKSNPVLHSLYWLHNNINLRQNYSLGILFSNQTLVLQGLKRNMSGRYSCLAINSEGETQSNSVQLTIKYRPVCENLVVLHYEANVMDEILLRCQVEANPPVRRFRWKLNNTRSILLTHYTSNPHKGVSLLTYRLRNSKDYGTLGCWAANDLGWQTAPCSFKIVRMNLPGPIKNCSESSHGNGSLTVTCNTYHNNTKHYQLELLSADKSRRIKNITATKPFFHLQDLERLERYTAYVYGINAKGAGPKQSLILTFSKTSASTEEKQVPLHELVTLWTSLGSLAGAVLCVCVLIAIIRRSSNHMGRDKNTDGNGQEMKISPDIIPEQCDSTEASTKVDQVSRVETVNINTENHQEVQRTPRPAAPEGSEQPATTEETNNETHTKVESAI